MSGDHILATKLPSRERVPASALVLHHRADGSVIGPVAHVDGEFVEPVMLLPGEALSVVGLTFTMIHGPRPRRLPTPWRCLAGALPWVAIYTSAVGEIGHLLDPWWPTWMSALNLACSGAVGYFAARWAQRRVAKLRDSL